MLTFALAVLFTMVALASVVSLSDSALKWRHAYRAMKAEMAPDRVTAVGVGEGAVVTLSTLSTPCATASQQVAPAPLAIAA